MLIRVTDLAQQVGTIGSDLKSTSETVEELRVTVNQQRQELNDHINKDAESFARIISALENIDRNSSDSSRRLFGNGQPGEIAKLCSRLGKLEWKFAASIGGGVVVVFLFDKIFHLLGMFK